MKPSRRREPILLVLLGASLALLAQACSSDRIEVIAHRGATKDAPENTLPAIQRAIDLGCDYAEVDVQSTSDRRLILMHDTTVDRTTTGKGKVEELTYPQISKLDAGGKFAENFRRTPVPLLEEALDLSRGRIKLYLDLKLTDPEPVVTLIQHLRMSRSVRYHALTLHALERIRHLDPEAEIIFDPDVLINAPGLLEAAVERLPGILLGSRVSAWKAETAAQAHRLGARIIVNVLAEEGTGENLRKAIALRPSAIQTDDPALLLKILRSR